MASLVVGGVTIPVAVSSPSFTRDEAVDRGRSFDNSYFASETGGAANDWTFSTPPVTPALAATYRAALGRTNAQLCSGDILEQPIMCFAEFAGGKPLRKASGHLVVIDFMLHEATSARMLLRYTPGDTIASETFTRASTAFYQNNAGVLVSVSSNVKRDAHYSQGVKTTLLEGARTNGLLRSQEFDNASWAKSAATITANAGNGPDGTLTADSMFETAVNSEHVILQQTTTTASVFQAYSVFVKAGSRTWCWLRTNLRDGTTPTSWINLSTGVVGTKAAAHTIRITALANSWYRVEVVVNSAAGGGLTYFNIGTATADNVSSYLGDPAQGITLWGAQHEQDRVFATSYIPTTGSTATRALDSYSIPFAMVPQEMTVYAQFVESGSMAESGAAIFDISSAGGAAPFFAAYSTGTVYRVSHGNGSTTLVSNMAVAPAIPDYVEIAARLYGDGSIDMAQSINFGAETVSALSAANPLAAAWSGLFLWLNSLGSANQGFIALQGFKVVAGSRSLAEMRAL